MSSIDACGSPPDGTASLISATMFRVVGIKRRLAVGGAKDLDLRQRIALEALDQDKVDVLEQPQELGQRRLRRSPQFPHQGDPIGGRDQHFLPWRRDARRILARLIEVEIVVGVLDRRNTEAPAVELGNKLDDQGRRPAPLHPAKADYPHDQSSIPRHARYLGIGREKRDKTLEKKAIAHRGGRTHLTT